jgi:hypothetical protein
VAVGRVLLTVSRDSQAARYKKRVKPNPNGTGTLGLKWKERWGALSVRRASKECADASRARSHSAADGEH